ncbi:hypothetical protein GLOTRDRAFT_91332 [Gloeophyllum trabeum ATCC 11539]|uniref:Uncharacterized protein n=1 Tax=Gloeophyllum trabeum (strain ATCC 11539 / FP-39264 / Madison 617) TaxID=670483 RepID=S7QKF5_GLOTA|nr:uncharacterized protein GLOTRDRAFT_91332 [Gloeophyllum trabeum ATCC 11539]EPQ59867.1 hypothetical protein GLOTRDRAFT_91332 [Gloeophyllum trabeum ATCC 11539]
MAGQTRVPTLCTRPSFQRSFQRFSIEPGWTGVLATRWRLCTISRTLGMVRALPPPLPPTCGGSRPGREGAPGGFFAAPPSRLLRPPRDTFWLVGPSCVPSRSVCSSALVCPMQFRLNAGGADIKWARSRTGAGFVRGRRPLERFGLAGRHPLPVGARDSRLSSSLSDARTRLDSTRLDCAHGVGCPRCALDNRRSVCAGTLAGIARVRIGAGWGIDSRLK